MKKVYAPLIFALTCFTYFEASSQLEVGDIAPDWTFNDLDGNEHNLYSILDQGKAVIIDASATWCWPCWEYHTSGELEVIHEEFGPEGTDQVRVFMIEADDQTNLACLMDEPGCNSTTQGDWVTGTPYPIINPGSAATNNFISEYSIDFYPILYVICPDRTISLASYWDFQTNTGQFMFSAAEITEAMESNCALPVTEKETTTLNVYPNPARDVLYISSDTQGLQEIVITDMLGKVVMTQTQTVAGSTPLALDIQSLENGVYTVSVKANNTLVSEKLVVQRTL